MRGQFSGKQRCFLNWKARFCWKTEGRIRNRNFSKVGTGTAINHYSSTTLHRYRYAITIPVVWAQRGATAALASDHLLRDIILTEVMIPLTVITYFAFLSESSKKDFCAHKGCLSIVHRTMINCVSCWTMVILFFRSCGIKKPTWIRLKLPLAQNPRVDPGFCPVGNKKKFRLQQAHGKGPNKIQIPLRIRRFQKILKLSPIEQL